MIRRTSIIIIAIALSGGCDVNETPNATETARAHQGSELRSVPYQRYDSRGMLVATGTRVSGVRHGMFTRVHATGDLAERGAWVDGERHGEWTAFYPGGTRFSQTHWHHGVPHGQWTFYVRKTGKRMAQMQFDRGKLVGDFIVWNTDGSVATVEAFGTELVQ